MLRMRRQEIGAVLVPIALPSPAVRMRRVTRLECGNQQQSSAKEACRPGSVRRTRRLRTVSRCFAFFTRKVERARGRRALQGTENQKPDAGSFAVGTVSAIAQGPCTARACLMMADASAGWR